MIKITFLTLSVLLLQGCFGIRTYPVNENDNGCVYYPLERYMDYKNNCEPLKDKNE